MSNKNLADWMKTLGLPADATLEDARKAFQKLVKKLHPNGVEFDAKNPPKTEEFQKAVEAWDKIKEWFAQGKPNSIQNPNNTSSPMTFDKMHLLDLAAIYIGNHMPDINHDDRQYGDWYSAWDRLNEQYPRLSPFGQDNTYKPYLKEAFPVLADIEDKKWSILEGLSHELPYLNAAILIYDKKNRSHKEKFECNCLEFGGDGAKMNTIGDLIQFLETNSLPFDMYSKENITVTDPNGNKLADDAVIQKGLTQYIVYSSSKTKELGSTPNKPEPLLIMKGKISQQKADEAINELENKRDKAKEQRELLFNEQFGAFLREQIKQHGEFVQSPPLAKATVVPLVGCDTEAGGNPTLLIGHRPELWS